MYNTIKVPMYIFSYYKIIIYYFVHLQNFSCFEYNKFKSTKKLVEYFDSGIKQFIGFCPCVKNIIELTSSVLWFYSIPMYNDMVSWCSLCVSDFNKLKYHSKRAINIKLTDYCMNRVCKWRMSLCICILTNINATCSLHS